MAHHKRKKARTRMSQGSQNYIKRALGKEDWRWYADSPSAHNILYHSRPKRRDTRHLERMIVKGQDPDEIVWPHAKKPIIYYW